MDGRQFSDNKIRKRKAVTQDNNERLSKRLSRLNLSHNGRILHTRPDTKSPASPEASASKSGASKPAINMTNDNDNDIMRLDNTKDKVYIYNLDDELSSSDDEAVEKIRFHPDLERHLQNNKIPASVLANSDGELAGVNHTEAQLVLYGVPKSLTVPEGQVDSVRKAIIEARARARGAKESETIEIEDSRRPAEDESNIPQALQGHILRSSPSEFDAAVDDPDVMDID